MKKDATLLKLEKKLENNTQDEIVLSKFNFSKPKMRVDFSTKINKEGLMDFLNQMKKSNEEMKNNPNNYNIEVEDTQEEGPKIELDIAMGVLEAQKAGCVIDIRPEGRLSTDGSCFPPVPGTASFAAHTVARSMVLPMRSVHEPSACFASFPVSMVMVRPSGRETVFVITFIELF